MSHFHVIGKDVASVGLGCELVQADKTSLATDKQRTQIERG